ncbi:transcription initiation factor TFIID subunit 4 [[Candida] anglica]|uniref:Transcription initiation factor TFIID subunit 4 n=1 Tax=[Candida] anglica TaxID=148631 RepID=A0ABP0EFN6_9ASCO
MSDNKRLGTEISDGSDLKRQKTSVNDSLGPEQRSNINGTHQSTPGSGSVSASTSVPASVPGSGSTTASVAPQGPLPTIGNDQLDAIFNEPVPELNIKQEQRNDINIDFDSLPADFLDNNSPFDLPSVGSNIGTPDATYQSVGTPNLATGNKSITNQQGINTAVKTSGSSTPVQISTPVPNDSSSTMYQSNVPQNNPRSYTNSPAPIKQQTQPQSQTYPQQAQQPQRPPQVQNQSQNQQPINNSTNNNHNKSGVINQNSRPMIYNPKSGYITTAPPINRMNPLVQQAQGIQGLNTSNIDGRSAHSSGNSNTHSSSSNTTGTNGSKASQLHTNDPSKLNDALAAAGVDIQQEEELLMQQHSNRNNRYTTQQQQYLQRQRQQQFPRTSPFLNPYHLSSFMQRVARENGVHQNFLQDSELLELVSAACENWISNLTTKTIILSRHRRRGIPTLVETKNGSGKKGNSTTTPSSQRSELSKELRNIAARQKELEERRVQKRIALGLENGTANGGDSENGKAGAEETLHRAANATAAMMSSGRKKYSWMTQGANAGGGADESSKSAEGDTKSKQSSLISIRGDNGLRFREIRSGKTVTMKDLLGALEEERMGTENALIKGYAKLKD